MLDISCESSARQMIHRKCQALFSGNLEYSWLFLSQIQITAASVKLKNVGLSCFNVLISNINSGPLEFWDNEDVTYNILHPRYLKLQGIRIYGYLFHMSPLTVVTDVSSGISREATLSKLFFPPFWKDVYSKRADSAPKWGANSF